METLEAIEKRRSITKYLDIPVEWDRVGNILRAGQLAPSAGNLQDWRFIVVTNKENRKKIAEACLKQYWIETAPVIIVACSFPENTKRFYGLRGEKLYTIQNTAAAIQNMLLAATDQGLGSHWVGAFDEGMLNRALGIPAKARPQAVLTFGYTDFTPPKPKRFKLFDLTYLQSWGNKVENADLVLIDWSDWARKKIMAAKMGVEQEALERGEKVRAKAKEKIKELHGKLKERFKKKPKEGEETSEDEQIYHDID